MAHYRRNAQRAARRRFRSRRDQQIFVRQMGAEANFHDATSPAGAQGPAQFMPGTARSVGLRNPRDPDQAYDAAARLMDRYLRQYNGDWRKALAAYNAGPGAVQRYGGVPPFRETQNYVQKILRGGSARADVTRGARRRGSVTTTETTTEPVQVSGGDQRLMLYQYLQNRHRPDALVNLALQMRAVEEATPEFATQTTVRTTRTPGGRRRRARSSTPGPGQTNIEQIIRMAQRRGLTVREHPSVDRVDPVHTAGSYHYRGAAADITGSPQQLARFSRYLRRRYGRDLEELIYNGPGGGRNIKNGRRVGRGFYSGHEGHLHAADAD